MTTPKNNSWLAESAITRPKDFAAFLNDLDALSRIALEEANWRTYYNDNNWIPPKHKDDPDYNGHSTPQAILCLLTKSEDWKDLAKKKGRLGVTICGSQTHI